MTGTEAIEARLQSLLEVDPTDDALAWLDRRVSQVIAQPIAQDAGKGGQRLRLLLRPLPLLVAFLVLTGAVAGALGLLERIATQSGAGYRVAWEQAEVLGISQTDAGYTVTLERAYADINQVVVFLNVEGPLTGEEGSSVDVGGSLIDAAGEHREQMGTGAVETDLAAVVRAWDTPAGGAGTYVLDIRSLQIIPGAAFTEVPAPIEGEWLFEFDVPEPDGLAIAPDVSSTVGAATVTLTEVRFSPSMIRGVMHLTVDGAPAPVWAPLIESVRHDNELVSTDTDANFYGTPIREEHATGFDFRTGFGTDIASGSWEITISEIQFPELIPAEDGTEEIDDPYAPLRGPWTLTFTVP